MPAALCSLTWEWLLSLQFENSESSILIRILQAVAVGGGLQALECVCVWGGESMTKFPSAKGFSLYVDLGTSLFLQCSIIKIHPTPLSAQFPLNHFMLNKV